MRAAALGEDVGGPGVHRERPLGEQKSSALEKFDQSLRALLEAWDGRAQLRPLPVVELRQNLGPARQIRERVDERLEKIVVRRAAHEMAVHVLELGGIEARGRAADRRQVEGGDQFLFGEELLVTGAPAEPRQVVAQRRRQVAHGAVGVDAERAVALGELRPVGAVDQRDVRPDRRVPAERLIDLGLAGGVGQVVVAADDVGHAHVVVVDDDGEHVGRVAVGSQEHEVVEVLVGEGHLALHLVVDDRLALPGGAQPNDRGYAGGRLGGVAVAPAAVVAHGLALPPRLFAHLLQILGAGVTAIGRAFGEHFVHDLAVPGGALELADRVAVPVEPEPLEPIEDRVDGGLRRALAVRVLDPQKEGPAEPSRVEPVEQGRARPADVEEPGRGGREAGDDMRHLSGSPEEKTSRRV